MVKDLGLENKVSKRFYKEIHIVTRLGKLVEEETGVAVGKWVLIKAFCFLPLGLPQLLLLTLI